jgi:hypothetical protein
MPSAPSRPSLRFLPRSRLIGAAAALLAFGAALGWGTMQLRRGFVRSFFRAAEGQVPPPLTRPATAAPGVQPVGQLRVLLIDGLDEPTARTLPALNALCAAGLDLSVDVGFPTVSLPVQAVLWTGLTQQQHGLLYRVAGLPTPLRGALPLAVPGSIAIAEEQPFIAASFGFRMSPPGAVDLAAAAQAVVTAPARLAFVHLLRVDKAGHKGRRDSPVFVAAAVWADNLLAGLLAAAPPTTDRRWLVLSDHGHRRAGGHGGAEREVRVVRACLSGGPPAPLTLDSQSASPPDAAPIHLVDLSRVVFESLGVRLPPAAPGRPLAFARRHPDPGATLPGLPVGRCLGGLVVLAVCWLLAARSLRRSGPWVLSFLLLTVAWPVATVSAVLLRGAPTLSNPMVYPPLGLDMMKAAWPGLLLMAVATGWLVSRRPAHLLSVVRAVLLIAVGPAVAAFVASNGPLAVMGLASALDPRVTGYASFGLALLAAAAPLLAFSSASGLLATWFFSRRDGRWPAGSS